MGRTSAKNCKLHCWCSSVVQQAALLAVRQLKHQELQNVNRKSAWSVSGLGVWWGYPSSLDLTNLMVSSCTSYLWLKAKNLQVWFRNQIIWKYGKFRYPEIWTLCIMAFQHFNNATCENRNMHRPTLSARLGLVEELQQCTPQSQTQPQTPWPHLQPLQTNSAMEMILQNAEFFDLGSFAYSLMMGSIHLVWAGVIYVAVQSNINKHGGESVCGDVHAHPRCCGLIYTNNSSDYQNFQDSDSAIYWVIDLPMQDRSNSIMQESVITP